jgi:N-acetylmuramoyl-L-alanine amidase
MKRRRTDYIVVHGTYTPAQMDVTWEDVDRWHRERGFNGGGYHYLIPRDGVIRVGRTLNGATPWMWDSVQGAGVLGYNGVCVHIAMAGGMPASAEAAKRGEWEMNYTRTQLRALRAILASMRIKYPDAQVVGHNDLDARKCPGFNVREWWNDGDC